MNKSYGAEYSELEKKLKEYIKERYGTVKDFTIKKDIPYSTLSSIFKRGISSANIQTIKKLCRDLEISTDELIMRGNIVPVKKRDNNDIRKITADFIATINGAQITIEGQPLSDAEKYTVTRSAQLSLDILKAGRKEKGIVVNVKPSSDISEGINVRASRKRSLDRRTNRKGAEIL